MKVYRIKPDLRDMINQNASVCWHLLTELNGQTVSRHCNDQITTAVNALAQLACDLYDELNPDEEEEDEDEDLC